MMGRYENRKRLWKTTSFSSPCYTFTPQRLKERRNQKRKCLSFCLLLCYSTIPRKLDDDDDEEFKHGDLYSYTCTSAMLEDGGNTKCIRKQRRKYVKRYIVREKFSYLGCTLLHIREIQNAFSLGLSIKLAQPFIFTHDNFAVTQQRQLGKPACVQQIPSHTSYTASQFPYELASLPNLINFYM